MPPLWTTGSSFSIRRAGHGLGKHVGARHGRASRCIGVPGAPSIGKNPPFSPEKSEPRSTLPQGALPDRQTLQKPV
jgi:hypothetical protein